MRDYHLMPWQVGDLTFAEVNEIVKDQDARIKAHNAQVRAQQRAR